MMRTQQRRLTRNNACRPRLRIQASVIIDAMKLIGMSTIMIEKGIITFIRRHQANNGISVLSSCCSGPKYESRKPARYNSLVKGSNAQNRIPIMRYPVTQHQAPIVRSRRLIQGNRYGLRILLMKYPGAVNVSRLRRPAPPRTARSSISSSPGRAAPSRRLSGNAERRCSRLMAYGFSRFRVTASSVATTPGPACRPDDRNRRRRRSSRSDSAW